MLFSDPQTGYTDVRSSEMSFNPVVNLVDQASKKGAD
jgi:hypothetical protein